MKTINADTVLAALGSLGLMLHDNSINPMVRVSNARHRIAKLVTQIEGQAEEQIGEVSVPLFPGHNSWNTTQTHTECQDCEAAVELAIQDATDRKLSGSTWTVSTPAARNPGEVPSSERLHVGTVTRIVV